MGAVPSVEDVLGRVAMFAGRVVTHRRLDGGLSHHIWVVNCGDRSYVLRVLDPAVSAAGLGVAPAREITNTLRAAESGVGARVFEVLPDVPALVLEYLPGRTLHADDVRQPAMIPRIAQACRRLHAGPRFAGEFSIVAKLHELLAICRRNDLAVPDGYVERLSIVEDVKLALDAVPLPSVPCHNDLLAENFIDSGGVIRIVDYQLAGNNDPSFELGNIAAEADFGGADQRGIVAGGDQRGTVGGADQRGTVGGADQRGTVDPDRTEALAAAYFRDELTRALSARVRLNLLLSNATWALWFTVHHGLLHGRTSLPAAQFDYAREATDKWNQAVRDMDSAELGRLLDEVSRSSPMRRPTGCAHP